MRVAHIIMAHKGPEQLLRLVERLAHPQFDFYVHVDAKASIEQFGELDAYHQLYFIQDRKHCNWGGWSFTRAILSAIREIKDTGIEYGYYNLLSGQDYPIRSADEIYQYLSERPGKNFIFYVNKDSEWWSRAKFRYELYHFTDINFSGKYLAQWILNAVLPKRSFPEHMHLYGGSNASWWTISAPCAYYIADKIPEGSKLDSFLKYCWGTDEFVITTIIMNSHFKEQAVNQNFRYIDWSEGGGHPKLLTSTDFYRIMGSEMMFARKFDVKIDSEILDRIDQYINNRNQD